MAQEFYGLDDECLLFTTNTSDMIDDKGRPLTLSQNMVDFGPSDAWAGMFESGRFFRIDGTTGTIKQQAQGPHAAYGATSDASGIIWIAVIGDGRFGYFDTANPSHTGMTRGPSGFGINGYGISLDRDQNVWEGGWDHINAYRYTPDRSNGFNSLGNGYWTVINNPGTNSGATGNGRGIAADLRAQNKYFVWMARDGGWIVRIPGSDIAKPQGSDVQIDGSGMPAIQVAGTNTIGAGVDFDLNVWGISNSGSVATRIKVDANGNTTAPDISSGTNDNGCPVGAGDRCTLGFHGHLGQDPYTYSDFTGFGLANFTTPRGNWSYIMKGCVSGDTHWLRVDWTSIVPANTSLTARARVGNTPTPDASWGGWSPSFATSPGDLSALMPSPAKYIQVEFDFTTMDKASTAKLKSFTVWHECGNIPG
jgi:hypothetical protein